MGIQGLLPLVKSIMVPIHIKDLEGSNVAVDTYSWLHKGALSCSRELCKGLPTYRHVEYCMRRVNLLRHYGVKPILVFDGGLLPMKIEQENKRSRTRKENLARAVEHERSGNSTAAYEYYQKAVDISPSIALELIHVLRQENVNYVVAPYEADAQMTFLAVTKHVAAVITEDSDLIPFGCPRIIFKMDKFGEAVEFQYSKLQNNKELNFDGFTRQMLLEMCILSGCDYLQSLPGMGLKRAHALIRKFKSYEKVLKHLRFSTVSVPPSYEDSFKKAMLTFQYQRVYDPLTEDIVHLSDLPDSVGDDIDFLGPSMPKHIAQGIANGDLDPFTKLPFQLRLFQTSFRLMPVVISVSRNGVSDNSNCKANELLMYLSNLDSLVDVRILLGKQEQSLDNGISTQRILCSTTLNPESSRKKLDLPVQKNLLTNYFCFASLEAKRKFKAPRKSPGSPSPLENSSASPEAHENTGHFTCEMNGFLAPQFDSGNITPDMTGKFSADNSELREFPLNEVKIEDERSGPKQTLLREPRNSIHKPCLTIQREREFRSIQENSFQVKMEVESRKVVRSPYFPHKPVPKNDKDDDQEKITDMVDDQTNLSKSTISRFQAKIEVEKRKVVTSRFFQHKPVPKNNKDDKKENLIDAVDLQNNLNNGIISQRAPDGSNMMNKALKRKTSPNDNLIRGNFLPKQMHVYTPIPHNGCYDTKMDKVVTESESQDEKFGSNISHLGHYKEVAAESVERFASIISKFKWTPASRVSGLRPPLRDVKNTNANNHNRPKVLDFSKFEYVPPNKKQR